MPTIAAILFMVAYNMCQWRTFVRLTKTAPKSDIAVLVMTFFLTVIFDLVVAIEIGMLLSCLLFMKRMSDETGVRSWLYVEEVEEQKRKEQEVRKAKKAGKAVITVKSKNNSALYATINVKVKNRYTKDQLRLMSSIIYSEAGDQSYAGKKAVGIVIANRVSSRSYPNTLSGVIYQPGQFSPARNGSLNRSLALYDSGRLDKGSIKAAKAVLNGDKNVKLSYGTINMNSYLFFSGYVKGARLTIGGHQFK